MAVISGRYGAVQRALPRFDSNGYQDKTNPWEPIANEPAFWEKGAELLLTWPTGVDASSQGSPIKRTMVSSMTSWSLENTINTISYQASNTRGYAGKVKGLHSATGTINGLGGLPPIAPGQRFRFFGYVGPNNSQVGSRLGTVYRIAALANNVAINISYEGTTPISWSVGWQSDYQLDGDELVPFEATDAMDNTFNDPVVPGSPPGAGFWDLTTPPCDLLMPSKNCALIISEKSPEEAGGSASLLDSMIRTCLQTANITFSTDIATFANSCSAAAGGWQSGVVGPTNCTIATTVHGSNFNEFLTNHLPGVDRFTRIYIGGGDIVHGTLIRKEGGNLNTLEKVIGYGSSTDQVAHDGDPILREHYALEEDYREAVFYACQVQKAYWQFKKMFLGSFGGLNVDTASTAPISFTCNMEYNAFPKSAETGKEGTCTYGYIQFYPGGKFTPGSPQTWTEVDAIDFLNLDPAMINWT